MSEKLNLKNAEFLCVDGHKIPKGDEEFDCSKFYYYRPSGAEGWGFYPCKNNLLSNSCDISNTGRFI